MVYYNKNGEIVNYNCEVNKFNNGTQGGIYKIVDNDSMCLKSYVNDDCIKVVNLSSSNIINTDVVIGNDKHYMDTESDKETLSYINKSYTFKGIFKDALKRHGVDLDNNLVFKRMIDSFKM